MTDIGRQFEEEFAEELGLEPVPGSGNQWHSKLDVTGGGARWSLKATGHASASIKKKDVLEAEEACVDTGEISLMGFALDYPDDPVIGVWMGIDTFKQLAAGELTLVTETKSDAKRRLAHLPELLREESDE